MSSFTQISLDFGPEQQSPAPDPTDRAGIDEASKLYMSASGVGVRIKSYKQTASPATGDLFGPAAEPQTQAEPQRQAEPQTQPELQKQAEAEDEPGTAAAVSAGDGQTAIPAGQATPAGDLPAMPESSAEIAPMEPIEPTTEKRRGRAIARPAAAGKRASNERGASKAASKRGRKSLKQVAAEADLIEIPEDEVLFSKQYYTMGEVSEMFRVNQSLLRFWEAEFDLLQPRKNKKGDRYFRPVDIKNLHLIYHLLRQRKYTIEGAKEFLKKNKKAEERFEVITRLQQIKAFLLEWKAQL